MKLYRSMLFVPGNRPEWMDKAPQYKPDALIVDLEDAMADSSLFEKDPKAFHARANRVAAARIELAKYEEEWLALEEKREALTRP